ncbi:retrovirus-related pol polyprotein from transposon TNT 1-94 [Tanacetum coccineum]|uniref:Retrovirus-related pol polyprotein from transposon TNT 1-94 n=1 Tax=Tanacetum coccineum TaxID=301880 RepID=A0ABQ4ZE18_9ASTR
MQDKNITISELKKLIEKCKGKSVETQFDKPFVVRQPNAQRIPKPSVLGKPTPFSNSPEMRSFQTKQSVNKTNVSDGMYRIATTTTQNREPQLPHASRNTNPHVSKSLGVNHTTSVSRPQLKLNQVKDRSICSNVPSSQFLLHIVQLILHVVTLMHKAHDGQSSSCFNFCEKFLVAVRFLEYQFAPILWLSEILNQESDPLCSSCEMSKSKTEAHLSQSCSSSKKADLLHMTCVVQCGLQKHKWEEYILLMFMPIQDSTWTISQVISVRTDRGTKFLNKTLHAYFKGEGHRTHTSTPRTPEQNGVVERLKRTLVEAARTMLSASKLPLSFWAEAGYRVYNKRTRLIVESIHIKFDEIKEMMSNHNSSDLAPQRQEMSVENVSFRPQFQEGQKLRL